MVVATIAAAAAAAAAPKIIFKKKNGKTKQSTRVLKSGKLGDKINEYVAILLEFVEKLS